MAKLIVKSLVVGEVATNCYLAINRETREAVILDPGDEAGRIESLVRENEATPVAILLTHGHFDHVMAAETLAAKYDIEIYALAQEKETLEDPNLNLCGMIGRFEIYHATKYVREGEILALAGFSFQVIHTPGHTPGGCCYYIPEENTLFSGDTLYAGTVGRTDFPKGSMRDLIDGIHQKLLTLPEETTVYPGHMGITSIGEEKRSNMFL